jgi:hypothetical protein
LCSPSVLHPVSFVCEGCLVAQKTLLSERDEGGED